MARKTKREKVTRSSGNVFADLGFENPEEELAKADLVLAISRAMSTKKLRQDALAREIGIDQAEVSRLLRGHTRGYSIERLMRILKRLGQDVEITVRPTKEARAKTAKVTIVAQKSSVGYPAAARSSNKVAERKAKYRTK
jgi:predicted XRE-type DNA-binding protein